MAGNKRLPHKDLFSAFRRMLLEPLGYATYSVVRRFRAPFIAGHSVLLGCPEQFFKILLEIVEKMNDGRAERFV